MKVFGIVITDDTVAPECEAALNAQTYKDFYWHVRKETPAIEDPNPVRKLYLNCAANREAARKLALARTDADAFLFVDSDVVIPPKAVAEFVRQARESDERVLGGWYSTRDGRWVAGRWVADRTFVNYVGAVPPSLTLTHMVGLGCAFMSRTVAELIPFEAGVDLAAKDQLGREQLIGECGMFGIRALDLGIPMFMVGEVVCQHLNREVQHGAA